METSHNVKSHEEKYKNMMSDIMYNDLINIGNHFDRYNFFVHLDISNRTIMLSLPKSFMGFQKCECETQMLFPVFGKNKMTKTVTQSPKPKTPLRRHRDEMTKKILNCCQI